VRLKKKEKAHDTDSREDIENGWNEQYQEGRPLIHLNEKTEKDVKAPNSYDKVQLANTKHKRKRPIKIHPHKRITIKSQHKSKKQFPTKDSKQNNTNS
jgi:hypothetical protein